MEYKITSEQQTIDLAKKIAGELAGGEIIGLIGNLGAGKTTFSRGLAAGLGIRSRVTSPTFVLMKVYPIKNNSSQIKKLVHIDAYRLKTEQDLISIGATEFFGRPDTVVLIEWADLIKPLLPKQTKYLYFKNIDQEKRSIVMK